MDRNYVDIGLFFINFREKNCIYSSDLVKFASVETNVGHYKGGLEIFLSNAIAIGGYTSKVEIFKNNKWENKATIGNSTDKVSYYGFSTMVLKENQNEFLFVFGKKIRKLIFIFVTEYILSRRNKKWNSNFRCLEIGRWLQMVKANGFI